VQQPRERDLHRRNPEPGRDSGQRGRLQRRETAQREEFECQRLVDLALDADRVGGKR